LKTNRTIACIGIVGNIRSEETNKKYIRININLLVWLSFQVAPHAGRFVKLRFIPKNGGHLFQSAPQETKQKNKRERTAITSARRGQTERIALKATAARVMLPLPDQLKTSQFL